MNQFYFGQMKEYIETGYAPTGRAKCKSCKEPIEKESLRIGTVMDDDHFSGRYWYHLPCFDLKPRFKEINPEEQIYQLDQLQPQDYDLVLDYMIKEVDRLKAGKKKVKASKKSSELPVKAKGDKQKSKAKDSSKQEEKPDPEDKESQPEEDQEDQDYDEKNKKTLKRSKNGRFKKQKSKSKSKSKSVKSQSKSVKSVSSNKQQKKKKKSKKAALISGYTAAQKLQYQTFYIKYSNWSLDKLKSLLGANNQVKTGTKGQLADKCADGVVLGKIPLCSECGGGKLRFTSQTGIYKCPGFMDDTVFRHCGKTYTMAEVNRQKWTALDD